MTRAIITVFASAAILATCLTLSGCSGSGGSSSTTVGVSSGYYGGSYWRDPYYRYGCCYNNTVVVRPPHHRPPGHRPPTHRPRPTPLPARPRATWGPTWSGACPSAGPTPRAWS